MPQTLIQAPVTVEVKVQFLLKTTNKANQLKMKLNWKQLKKDLTVRLCNMWSLIILSLGPCYLVEGQLHASHRWSFRVGSMIESRDVISQISGFHHELLNLLVNDKLTLGKWHTTETLICHCIANTSSIGLWSCITKNGCSKNVYRFKRTIQEIHLVFEQSVQRVIIIIPFESFLCLFYSAVSTWIWQKMLTRIPIKEGF